MPSIFAFFFLTISSLSIYCMLRACYVIYTSKNAWKLDAIMKTPLLFFTYATMICVVAILPYNSLRENVTCEEQNQTQIKVWSFLFFFLVMGILPSSAICVYIAHLSFVRATKLQEVYTSDVWISSGVVLIVDLIFTTSNIVLHETLDVEAHRYTTVDMCGTDPALTLWHCTVELVLFLIFIFWLYISGLRSYLSIQWETDLNAVRSGDIAQLALTDVQSRLSAFPKLPETRSAASKFKRADNIKSDNTTEDLVNNVGRDFWGRQTEALTIHLHNLSIKTMHLTDAEIRDLQKDQSHVFTPELLRVIHSFDDFILRSIAVIAFILSFHWSSLILELVGVKSNGMFVLGLLGYLFSPVIASYIFFRSPSLNDVPLFICKCQFLKNTWSSLKDCVFACSVWEIIFEEEFSDDISIEGLRSGLESEKIIWTASDDSDESDPLPTSEFYGDGTGSNEEEMIV